MASDGYISRDKPDASWWMTQVQAGMEFRKQFAHQQKWQMWRNYYRGQWRPGILPVNLFFTMMRTIVPRVYFRNPSVSVTPTMPGPAAVAFAQVLERCDNKLLALMGAKRHFKRAVQHAFQFGAGVVKLGFGAEYTPTPDFGFTAAPVSRSGHRVEYRDGVYPMMPWVGSVHPGAFVVPDGTRTYEEARWVAHWVQRPVEDVKEDRRLKNTETLGSSSNTKTPMRFASNVKNTVDMVDLVEIRDKKRNTVMVLNPYGGRDVGVLYSGPDELQANGSIPFYPIIFNEDDEVFWGTPDSQILEPYQLEINETNTQIMKHRRMSLVKIFARIKGIDEQEAQKMLSEDVSSVVNVNGDPREIVSIQQISNIPQDLLVAKQGVMNDVRESIGFSRNQFGEYNSKTSDTTATEANIVREATEIRVDERRDIVADVIVQIAEDMHSIIFRHWTGKQVMQVTGPGGIPVWVQFTGSELAQGGRFTVKVDPDSSVPETKQLREARASQVYQLLKTNPIIDPMKLTQYLLHELHGVQFDDMMRALPPVAGMNPGATMSLPQYGGMVQQSMAALPQAANG